MSDDGPLLSVWVLCAIFGTFFFGGNPDLHDALMHFLMAAK